MGNPTMVLIHGICCHGSDWTQQSKDFGQTIPVVAPTLLGHGDDTTTPENLTIPNLATNLAQFLENKGSNEVILCGHSLGCRVALELAVHIPNRVQGIILVDGSNKVQGDTAKTLNTFDQITHIHSWVQSNFDQMFLPDSLTAEQVTYRDRIKQMPGDTLKALYRNMILWDGTKLIPCLRKVADTPLLVIQSTDLAQDGARRSLKQGERSAYVDMLDAEHPHCQIITYLKHGHFLHLESPEKFVADVKGWMVDNALITGSDSTDV